MRGNTLASTLLLIALLLLTSLTVVGIVINHVRVAQRVGSAQHAQNRAESLLALAVSRWLEDPAWGRSRLPEESLTLPGLSAQDALLTFHQETAALEGLPWSTNNVRDLASSAPGSGDRIVPAHSVHLVARGRYRGVTRTLEAIVSVPPYPYVVASEGPIASTGSLLVASASAAQPESLGPGHLASNSRSPVAIRLGPANRVTGDVRAPGGIQLDPEARVEGRVREATEPVAIPRFALREFDPVVLGKLPVQSLNDDTLSQAALEGYARHTGDLRAQGGLTLRGAVLFVEGDLVVDGGLTGTGCIVATGSILLRGRCRWQTDNEAALLCGGDLRIEGEGRHSSSFQGLVYSQGGIVARDVSLKGTMLSAGDSGVKLQNAAVIHVPEYASVEVGVETATATLVFPGAGTEEHEEHEEEEEEEEDEEDEEPDRYVLEVGLVPDGTYRVLDPRSGALVEGLTRELAVEQIADWVQAHQNQELDPQTRAAVWERLGQLTLPAPGAAIPVHTRLEVDANQLLGLQQKARIVLWRELEP